MFGFIEKLALSCVSSYVKYYDAKSQLKEKFEDKQWQLTKDDIIDCYNLQERLLDSSWNLVHKYNEDFKEYFKKHFQSDHMIVSMSDLENFNDALSVEGLETRIVKLRRLEDALCAYPPYWCYRAKTAKELSDDVEAHSCFERFNEVWRSVLLKDPYKVEELKFRISEILKKRENLTNETKHEAFRLLEGMMRHVPPKDWANDLFAGTAYFSLGSRDKGIEIIQAHGDVEICKTLLNDFKLKDALVKYFEGNEAEAGTILESLSRTSENSVVFAVLTGINASKNYVKFAKFNKSLDYLLKGKGKAAYFAIQPLVESYAKKQVPSAEWLLGAIYSQRENNPETIKWYQKSAEHGFCMAQNQLARIYQDRNNHTETIKWLRLAANQGFALSQYNLGNMYHYGYGVKQNYAEAVNWYRKAADQGYAAAQAVLGAMYLGGHGVRQDIVKVANLLLLAAEQGLAEAQRDLGNKYNAEARYFDEKGKKRPELYRQAYFWYSLSVLCGGSKTKEMIEIEGKEGILWNDDPLISEVEIKAAQAEARRKYDEIMKRNRLD